MLAAPPTTIRRGGENLGICQVCPQIATANTSYKRLLYVASIVRNRQRTFFLHFSGMYCSILYSLSLLGSSYLAESHSNSPKDRKLPWLSSQPTTRDEEEDRDPAFHLGREILNLVFLAGGIFFSATSPIIPSASSFCPSVEIGFFALCLSVCARERRMNLLMYY